jgi:hypothetical protein
MIVTAIVALWILTRKEGFAAADWGRDFPAADFDGKGKGNKGKGNKGKGRGKGKGKGKGWGIPIPRGCQTLVGKARERCIKEVSQGDGSQFFDIPKDFWANPAKYRSEAGAKIFLRAAPPNVTPEDWSSKAFRSRLGMRIRKLIGRKINNY